MELAYQGEITTPSRCGRMDQGCAYGNRPILMTYDGDRIDVAELSVQGELHFVLVDLGAKKDTVEILARLNRAYPFAETGIERGVQELLGPINKRVVHNAVEAVKMADAERVGALMNEAQAFFDRYAAPSCPEELTAPLLHRVLSLNRSSRMSGAARGRLAGGRHRAVYRPKLGGSEGGYGNH